MLVVIKIILWAMIIYCVGLAAVSAYRLTVYYKVKKNGVFAEGTVVGFEEKGDVVMSLGTPINQSEPRKLYPIVEYPDESGMTVRAVYKGFVLKGSGKFSEGQKLQIKYDPLKPDEFIIIGDGNLHGNAWGFIVLGISFAVIGAVMLKIMF